MGRTIWSLGVLVGLAGAAQALPAVDCTDGGVLLEAEAGLVSLGDEVFEISVHAGRDPGERPEVDEVRRLSPEAFCRDRGGMVAFILPVPKVNPGEAPVNPDLPDPGVGPGPSEPTAGFDRPSGTYGMTPGKAPADEVAPEVPEAPEDEPVPAQPLPDQPGQADEPAPSPSRPQGREPLAQGDQAGCGAAPGGGSAGWLLFALALLRRKGGAR